MLRQQGSVHFAEMCALWGIEESFFVHHPATTRQVFSTFLTRIEPKLRTTTHRLVPSSFDPNDPSMNAVPLADSWRWHTCERALRTLNVRALAVLLPEFWQVEPLLFFACRSAHVPLFPVQPDNMAVASASVRTAGIDTVIAQAETAETFCEYLRAYNDPTPYKWLIVHTADAPVQQMRHTSLLASTLAHEVHLFPGVPIFTQCDHLMEYKERPSFHLSGEFLWETDSVDTCITAKDLKSIPIFNFKLPHNVSETGVCPCGESTIVYG